MNRDLFRIRFVCAVAACVVLAAPAAAQESDRPRGEPFSGLFRGSPKEQPHTLDLRGSVFGAWDDNLLAQVPGLPGNGTGVIDPRGTKPGIASGLLGSVMYGFRKRGTRSQFSFNADSSVQEFSSSLGNEAFWYRTYGLSTGLTTGLTNRTSVSFGGATAYVPYFRYAPFLKETASAESPVGSDYGFAVNSSMVRSTAASASIENRFSKKSAISGGVSWEQSVIPGYEQSVVVENVDPTSVPAVAYGTVDRCSLQVSLTHNLTRKLVLRAGYAATETRYLANREIGPPLVHNLIVGLGYNDGISLTFGRQTLSLSGGLSVERNGDPAAVATSKQTAIAVTGRAILTRPIGRSWGTSLAYLRGTQYVVGFREPLIEDSANAGIGGPLFSRLQFSAGAGASRGQQLFTDSNGSVISYTASTRLTLALFANLGLYGQASYYRFSIPSDFANFGFVPKLDRRTVSVGLSTWIPLIKQRRPRGDTSQPSTGQP